jgi:hypothetical protein
LSPERWRLFFALPIEEPALSALVRWRDDALGGAAVRLPAARDLHITLVFLGGRDPQVVPELMRAARRRCCGRCVCALCRRGGRVSTRSTYPTRAGA